MSNEFVYLPANTGEAYWVMGDMFMYLVTGAESGGSYFTLIADVAPHGGPPPHVHHLEEEQFYVLEGEYEMYVGDEKFRLGPGDSLFAPRKIPHVWGCVSEKPGRIMAILQPAGTIESFFRELPKYIANRASPEEFQKLNQAHGMEVVGPRLPIDD